MSAVARWWATARSAAAHHPRIGLATRAAIAAAGAWWLAQLIPGPLSDYPYYAPLGAVIATTAPTLAGSVRESAQTVASIGLGAAIALTGAAVFGPQLVTLAVVVAAGVLLAGWRRLGAASSWVPTSALFVLIIGNTNTTAYVLGYAGLTLLGALVGVAVTSAFPPLPLTPAQATLAALRETLAGQLDDLADALRPEIPPTPEEWRDRMRSIDPLLADMRTAVQRTAEARRGNRLAARYRDAADRQYRQARALESLALLVEALSVVLAETEAAGNERLALGPQLRPGAARTLSALAEVLRSVDGPEADPEAVRRADEALAAFTAELRRVRVTTDDDLFEAGNIVENVRRALAAVRPADGEHEPGPSLT